MNAREVLVRQLEPILERERLARRRLVVGIGVLLLALVAFVLWTVGVRSALVFVALPFAAASLYVVARVWASDWVPDMRALARRIEGENPELNSLLITAVEQDGGGEIGYLQERVVIEAVQAAMAKEFSERVSRTQARVSRVLELSGAVALVVVWALFFPKIGGDGLVGGGVQEGEKGAEEEVVAPGEVSVEPGDVEVERGSRLVIRARFSERDVPGEASLVVAKHDGTEQRMAMKMALGDPVFTAVLESVEEDVDYRVEFGERASDEFAIDTYVLPTLERSDVVVVEPEWVGGGEKARKDTLRASVSEGGKVTFTFHLNKVVTEALLVPVPKKGKGRSDQVTSDQVASGEAIALGGGAIVEAAMVPEASGKWRLTLVDEDGRENRDKPVVAVTVKRNLPPKIELAFPKGDVDATPVQEVPLEASFWDDYEVVSAGLKFRFKGEESDVAFETVSFKPDQKNSASTMLALESMGAKPNDLVTYHWYAEDETTKGEKRRVESDMFFVEVRHFEEIFREGAGGESAQQQQQQQQQGEQQGAAGALLEAQKDVINATWKVRREGEVMVGEVPVLKAGQEEVVVLSEEARGDVEDEEVLQALESAVEAMGEAVTALGDEDLVVALEHEQTAYGHLLAMRAREFEIQQQSQSQSQSQSQQQQQRQRQLMQMDMKEEEDRYETAKFAQEQQQEQQMGEDAAILSRLKELAQRQEAIAEKLKELEAALAAAEDEAEEEELERQLKRLRDEQRELLEDMDSVAEKMESEENRARTSEAREQLEEARENAQQAAEKMQEGAEGSPQEQVAEAANEASRAGEKLDELQDDFREQSASAFGEAMQQMRDEVRELARNEEKLAEAIEEGVKQQGNADFEARAAAAEIATEIREQKEALESLLESMGEVSEQAEAGETLLSQKLYDALREAKTGGVEEALEEAATRVGWGRFGQAAEEEEKASAGIEKLQAAVENAAESVLGDEAAGLRAARDELERLREEMRERGESEQVASDQVARGGGESGEEQERSEGEESQGRGEGEVAQEGEEGEPPGRGQGEGQEGQEGEGQEGQEGQGRGQGEGEMAQEAGEQPGEGRGQGQEGQGQQGQGRGEGEGQEVAQEGEGEGRGQGQPPGRGSGGQGGGGQGGEEVAEGGEPREGEQEGRGGSGGPQRSGRFFESWTGFAEGGGGGNRVGPLDEAFKDWADRLRDVEEMVGSQELREEVQRAREAAKELRQEFGDRHSEAPEWDLVEMKLVEPLERLERAVREELAKRTEPDSLAPVDRDPVPRRFEELVRKYYEELGSGY